MEKRNDALVKRQIVLTNDFMRECTSESSICIDGAFSCLECLLSIYLKSKIFTEKSEYIQMFIF